MIDSGSWFAIWAICLNTSFLVMIPSSLLEEKRKGKVNNHLIYHFFFPLFSCRDILWVLPYNTVHPIHSSVIIFYKKLSYLVYFYYSSHDHSVKYLGLLSLFVRNMTEWETTITDTLYDKVTSFLRLRLQRTNSTKPRHQCPELGHGV